MDCPYRWDEILHQGNVLNNKNTFRTVEMSLRWAMKMGENESNETNSPKIKPIEGLEKSYWNYKKNLVELLGENSFSKCLSILKSRLKKINILKETHKLNTCFL